MLSSQFLNKLILEAQITGVVRVVVGASIFCNEATEPKILLLKRSDNDFMGGILELPSGKVEFDENLSDALAREVFEEAGLKIDLNHLNDESFVNFFDYVSGSGKNTRQFNFLIDFKNCFGNVQLSPEHVNYFWLTKDKILKNSFITSATKQTLLLSFEKI